MLAIKIHRISLQLTDRIGPASGLQEMPGGRGGRGFSAGFEVMKKKIPL